MAESSETREMKDGDGRPYQRTHECWPCKHSWDAPVVHSSYSRNLSGEQTVYCPKCHKAASAASPVFRVIDGMKVEGHL